MATTPATPTTTPTTPTVTITTFILTHFVWVVALAIAFVGVRAWISEHDQRIAAGAALKTAEANVTQLQAQIKAADAAAAQKVKVVTKIVHDVQTTPQAVAAIPQLTNSPLNARPAVDNPAQISVDAIPLIQVLGQAKTDAINLGACQADLKNETAIAAQKDTQIAALKKKPSFFKRVGSALKLVGIGIGIGAVLGAHL